MPRIKPLRLALLLAPVLALGLVQPLAQSTAQAAAVPVPKTRAFLAGIDTYPSYVGQTACNGTAKPGVVITKDLLNATYGQRTIGIVRSCTNGGTSEHKEGRALDWMINSRVAAQKAQADAFIEWLLATDGFGNPHAMARRMGIMYVIWNNKMWRAYDPGRGWTEYSGCSSTPATSRDTVCHRDHVHISFTWDGAYARTSFFTGQVPFKVSAGVSAKTPAVGSTVRVSGTVSPVAGAAGKRVSVNRLVGNTVTALGSAVVDATGRYAFSFATTKSDVYRFTVKKASEGCAASRGCAYGAGTSPEVAVVVGLQVKARYVAKVQATPDLALVGTPVLFRGTVTPANVAQGKPVMLKRWNTKTRLYDPISTALVKADGTVSFTATPPKGFSQYVIIKPGEQCSQAGCAYVRGVSRVVAVRSLTSVPYSVTANASAVTVPVGGTAKIRGVVGPTYASAGSRLALQRIVAGKPASAGSVVVGPRGEYTANIAARATGVQQYRLYKAADRCTPSGCDYSSAASAPITVTVVPVRSFTATSTAAPTALVRQPVLLNASFAPAKVAAGKRVTLQYQTLGNWKTTSVHTLDSRGMVSVSSTAMVAGIQKWRYAIASHDCASGVCAYRGVASPTTSLTIVVPKQQQLGLSTQVSATSAKVGRSVVVTGRVTPGQAAVGSTITLRRQTEGVPTIVSSSRVAADGSYRLVLAAKAPGAWIYRVYAQHAGCSPYGCIYAGRVSERLMVKVVA